jgi:hypothetical protein
MRRASLFAFTLFAFAITQAHAQSSLQILQISNRTYELSSDTPVVIDDAPAVLSDLIDQPRGLQASWMPASADARRGGVPLLVFSYTLIGPVTGIDPLRVLGQPVTITGDAEVEGFVTPDELVIGDAMIVAGLVDPNGSLYATLGVRREVQGNKYLITGYVQETVALEPRLRLGEQWMETTGVAFDGCAGGFPVVGDYLQVRADSIVGFTPGDVIDTVVSAQCATPVPLGTAGAQGVLEGIVGVGVDGESFMLGAVSVGYDATTVFEFGGPDDLEPGVNVSVEGVFVDATTFTADNVEFVRPVVRFQVPMVPGDVTPGVSIRPFGVDVLNSAQLRDEDGILAGGLAGPTQVEVRGWLDRDGRAFATRVRERGDADPDSVDLRGPLDAFSRPTLSIQGLTIDTTGATFFDADGLPLTVDEFFARLEINHVIDVGGAVWNEATTTLTGGAITELGFEHTQPVPGPIGAIVAGTMRGITVSERIFVSGFETLP